MPIKMMEMIRIIMVGTTHPGNVGAAARAMKTMGLKQLYLVKPRMFPSAEATAIAAGADDILADATLCDSLEAAISDCALTVATSARPRSIPWPIQSPHESALKMIKVAESAPVALVFGRESAGLTNEELELCNTVVQVPANPEFNSLNVAAAVQIMCYEIRQAALEAMPVESDHDNKTPLAKAEDMQRFFEHLERCMKDIGFYDPERPRRLMRRLKRLFNRAQLDKIEMNMLRGFLAAIQEAAGKDKP